MSRKVDEGSGHHVPSSARIGRQDHFQKVLSFHELYFISLSGMIGSAWLFGSLYGAAAAGPASIISWLLGGLFVIFIALTWAEIGGMLPATGAVVRAPQYAHGYFTGFYFGWTYFMSAVIIPAVEAVAIITYADAFVQGLLSNGNLTFQGYLLSVAVLVMTFLLNSYGVKLFARLNTGITWLKILVPSITVILTLLFLYPPNFSAFGGFAPNGVLPILSAVGTAGIVYAYMGFRAALDYSGEARNPTRDVPRAVILAVLTTIVLYTFLQTAFIGGLRWNASGLTPGDWSDLSVKGSYSSAPYVQLLTILGFSLFATVLLIMAVIFPLGTTLVYSGSSARDLFALTEGGHVSTRLGDVHGRYGVPRIALLCCFLLSVFFIFAFPNWKALAAIGTATMVFTQLAGSTTLMTLRRTAPSLRRSFRLPFAKVLAPTAFAMSSIIVYWTTWPYTAFALIAIIIGLAFYSIGKSRGVYPIGDVKHGIWIVVYSAVMIVLSYLGSFGINYIAFPLDMILVIVASLLAFHWGIRSGYKTEELKELLAHEARTSSKR
jgi:amino acid transporter